MNTTINTISNFIHSIIIVSIFIAFGIAQNTFSVAVGSQIGLDWGAGSHSDDVYMQWANTDTTNGNMWVDSYTQAYEIIGGCPNYCWYG